MIRVSAPGKMLLMGDHAVVYGRSCLVTAVDARLTVTIEPALGKDIQIVAPQVSNTTFISRSIAVAQAAWGVSCSGLKMTTESMFSSQYGLGSSSAVTVATIVALSKFFKRNDTLNELFLLSRQVVFDVQGAGSGFDVAAALLGGTLYYEKITPTLTPVPIHALPLVIGYTGSKASTTMLVEDVARKREREPQKVDRIFDAIQKLVEDAKHRMEQGEWDHVGKLFDFNQEYLRDLGVSSEKLETLILAAKHAGAWGAKLSGAGGGDCMIALAPDDRRSAVEEAIVGAGGEIVRVAPHAEGVRVEV
jgi:mevalonate kinase